METPINSTDRKELDWGKVQYIGGFAFILNNEVEVWKVPQYIGQDNIKIQSIKQ